MKDPRSILITGASSGIGAALALAYAGPGVSLALGGRDAGRLEAVAAACRQRGAAVHAGIIDVADREAMARWIEEIDRAAPIDLVIANAGIGVGTHRRLRDRGAGPHGLRRQCRRRLQHRAAADPEADRRAGAARSR